MFVRSGLGLSALNGQLNIPARLRSHIPEEFRKDPSTLVSDTGYHWVVLPTVSMSAAHPQLPSPSLKKKKKIRVATFQHAGDAIKDLKKIVSLKRSVRISSGDRTWCQKRHLCCVTHSISWSVCLFTSKGRCGIWGCYGWRSMWWGGHRRPRV